MYAKMFTQIFDSSIADDYQVRHVFEDLCKLADRDGVVDMTPEAISARTRVPLDVVKPALTKLQAPDPRSRSPEEEGRRLVLIDSHRDWGWRIVNYQHYRDLRDDDARRSYFRDYMREYRAKKKGNAVINSKHMLNGVNSGKPPSTHAEAEAEAVRTHTQSFSTPVGDAPAQPGVRASFKDFIPDESVKVGGTTISELKAGLCKLVKRPETDGMTYLEESLLVTIAKRPRCMEELETLVQFNRKLVSKRFFPQKLERLLGDWQGTLDRARKAERNPSLYSA